MDAGAGAGGGGAAAAAAAAGRAMQALSRRIAGNIEATGGASYSLGGFTVGFGFVSPCGFGDLGGLGRSPSLPTGGWTGEGGHCFVYRRPAPPSLLPPIPAPLPPPPPPTIAPGMDLVAVKAQQHEHLKR
jgi:hypothetical protein